MAEGNQQQQQNPTQSLTQALDRIRRVQGTIELNAPNQGELINMLREAGDLVWGVIEQQQQQQ
jgi:hypothetical protein